MSAHKDRNGKIDLLKLIFAIIVVFNHSKHVVGSANSLFLGGSFAVEFFFLVSGYLMMASVQKIAHPPVSLGMETKDFLLRKFKSFYPEVFLAYIVGFLTFAIALKPDLPKMFMQTFSEFLLINMSGLWVTKMNTAIWYLSSMLFAMAILYPLLRKFNTTVLYIVIPISSLFLLGWLCANGLSPRGPLEWAGWTYRGNIRALAELGIGICLYPVVEKVKRIDFTIFARCLLTAVEYACYILIIYYMYEKTASRLDYFYLLVFAVALTISFSQKGIDSSLFKGRFFWLGKYSFSLFLSHYFYAKTVKIFFPQYSGNKLLIIYFTISALTALLIMILSDLIRKHGSKLKLKRLFVRPTTE